MVIGLHRVSAAVSGWQCDMHRLVPPLEKIPIKRKVNVDKKNAHTQQYRNTKYNSKCSWGNVKCHLFSDHTLKHQLILPKTITV